MSVQCSPWAWGWSFWGVIPSLATGGHHGLLFSSRSVLVRAPALVDCPVENPFRRRCSRAFCLSSCLTQLSIFPQFLLYFWHISTNDHPIFCQLEHFTGLKFLKGQVYGCFFVCSYARSWIDTSTSPDVEVCDLDIFWNWVFTNLLVWESKRYPRSGT